jgi:hypothetical protein
MVTLTDSELVTVDENAFDGLPSLEDLDLSGHSELKEQSLSNLMNLTSINLNTNLKLEAVFLTETSRLDSILLEYNYDLSNIHSIFTLYKHIKLSQSDFPKFLKI